MRRTLGLLQHPLRALSGIDDTGATLHIVCPQGVAEFGGDEFKQCEGWHHGSRSEKRLAGS